MLRTSLVGLGILPIVLHGQISFAQTDGRLAKFSGGGVVNSICHEDASGKIGISDTTPTYKLDVNGDFRADGIRTNSGDTYPNFIGGASSNAISASIDGGAICGGRSNIVSDDYSFVGGGYYNTIYEMYGTISGGNSNTITYSAGDNWHQTVSGGYDNTSDGYAATIGGGYQNSASSLYAVVPGGRGNTASGAYSFAANGYCDASGSYSIAMGYDADPSGNYSAAFGGDTAGCGSATANQFLVCYDGGAYIDLDGAEMFVDGAIRADDFIEYSPYPDSLETAYRSIFSMQRLPDGEYEPDNTRKQLDHSMLHPFIRRLMPAGIQEPDKDQSLPEIGCSLSAVVGSHNEVIKDLVLKIEQLESRVQELETNCPGQ
jgi:hypothetical protein